MLKNQVHPELSQVSFDLKQSLRDWAIWIVSDILECTQRITRLPGSELQDL